MATCGTFTHLENLEGPVIDLVRDFESHEQERGLQLREMHFEVRHTVVGNKSLFDRVTCNGRNIFIKYPYDTSSLVREYKAVCGLRDDEHKYVPWFYGPVHIPELNLVGLAWKEYPMSVHESMYFILLHLPPKEFFARAKDIISGMFGCVKWLHENDFVHGDIKPSNFLVADVAIPKWILVTDFEGTHGAGSDSGTRFFTPAFASEAVMEGRTASAPDDLISLAYSAAWLLQRGNLPWDGVDGYDPSLRFKPRVIPKDCDKEIARFLNSCYEERPFPYKAWETYFKG